MCKTDQKLSLSPFIKQAIERPQALAFNAIVKGKRVDLSYSQAQHIIDSLVVQLKSSGLTANARIACISANKLEMALLYWACIQAQILFCPISPKFTLQQQQKLIHDYDIEAFWSPEELALIGSKALTLDWQLEQIQDSSVKSKHTFSDLTKIDIKAPANLVLTSGSSGFPKAAVHSLANHIASAEGSATKIPLTHQDSWLLSLPLFHIGGLAILNRCALAGACVVFPDSNLELAAQLTTQKITHLSLVEAQLIPLLAQPESLNRTKFLLLGGGSISSKYLDALSHFSLQAFTSYGMTEMSSQITTGKAQLKGSGSALPGREVMISEEGVIQVKGATLFLGYLQPSKHSTMTLTLPLDSNGWFNTKDTGYWTPEGQITITGRTDNMFICGGENIQPEEIEAALKLHPAIKDAIVFGEPDAQFGQLPAAIIKLADEQIMPEQQALDSWIIDKIARFKRPRRYYPWPNETANTGLKVNRKAIIAAVAERPKI